MARPQRDRPPTYRELADALDEAERRLTVLYSRWGDGLPTQLRVDLHDIAAPLLRILIRIGRR